jgi:NADPH:quinone reductase-like Zn-dependent oxidoreductase
MLLFACVAGVLSTVSSWQPAATPARAESSMKAVRYHQNGGPEVLKYEDAPRPEPKGGEVLVRVHAAGVNPVDWKMRSGRARAFPATPGYDVSGVIESVGEGVKDHAPGDEVFAMLPLSRGGGYAEYAVVRADELAPKPKSVDHVHAAGVPLAALTAWQALVDKAHVQAGQTVLVHAGAGGVGHFAVQIAKVKGARVIATASERNRAFVTGLGADDFIDYTTTKFEDAAKEVDVVLDCVGGDTLARSYGVVKQGGTLVTIAGAIDDAKARERGITGVRMLVTPSGPELRAIGTLIDAGKITPHVSETLKLEEAAKAQERSEAGKTRGKIVLRVR